MKFSGLWGIHWVYGFDQTQKDQVARNINRPDKILTICFYLMFLNVQLSLEGQLSPLRILEAEVENFENSNPMLDDDGVQQGKNVSLGKRC